MSLEADSVSFPRIVGPFSATAASRSARDASVGSAIRLSAEMVVRLSSIVATLWLTRSLGVATFGAFLLALSIGLMVAELCDLGLNAIVVPLLVRTNRNLRTLLVMKGVMTAGVIGLCLALMPLAAWVSGVSAWMLGLCTIHFLGASWIEIVGTSLRGLGRRVDEALVLLVFRFTLVGLVIGAPFGMTLLGVSLSYALAVGPAVVFGGLLLRARVTPDGPGGADIRSIVRQAVPMGVNGYLAILSTRIELFVLQAFQGAQLVGLFGGALRIVESLLTFPSAIAAGALPSVARDAVRGSRGAAQRMFGLVIWVGVPAGVGLFLCAPGVLDVLGSGFMLGASALRVLSVALVLCFANAALFHVLIAAGETAIIPRLTAMRVGVALVLGPLLIPLFGVVGASISFTAAELFLFVALVRRARAHAEIQVARPVGLALLACVPMIAVLSLWPMSLPASMGSGGALFAAAAALIMRRGTVESGLA